jgi:hypothetical protein
VVLVLVLVSVLQLVGVLWLGLVVGLGVFRVVVRFGVFVVFVVLLVILKVGVLDLDRVDSAWDWLGRRCYGVLAEGLVVGGGQLGGCVSVVGVLRDLDGLDGGVRVGVVVSAVVGGGVVRVRHDD